MCFFLKTQKKFKDKKWKDSNSYQIAFILFSCLTQKKSKDKQGFHFMSIYFQLMFLGNAKSWSKDHSTSHLTINHGKQNSGYLLRDRSRRKPSDLFINFAKFFEAPQSMKISVQIRSTPIFLKPPSKIPWFKPHDIKVPLYYLTPFKMPLNYPENPFFQISMENPNAFHKHV